MTCLQNACGPMANLWAPARQQAVALGSHLALHAWFSISWYAPLLLQT